MFRSLITNFIFSTSFILMLLLFSLVYASWERKWKFSLILLFWVIFLSHLGSWVLSQYERRYSPLQEIPVDVSHILVLGSGGTPEEALSVYQRVDEAALQRVMEGIRLWKKFPDRTLVFSSRGKEGYPSQAAVYADIALDQGVDPEKIFLLKEGITTETEVKDWLRNFPETKKLVLVSSASHLLRASKIADFYGLDVVPAPAHFVVKLHPAGWRLNFLPSIGALEKWDILFHEWGGLIWIELRGKLGLIR